MTRDSITARRDMILAAAGDAMTDARRRRTRVARISSAAAILAVAFLAALIVMRPPAHPDGQAASLAIDFESVDSAASSIDFAIVRDTGVPILDTLTDEEAEHALAESGYCVKIFRLQDRPLLVDCTSGAPAAISPGR